MENKIDNKKNIIDVSIVIICMNNLNNLYPCLESIKKYTSISYETFVIAYLFSSENLSRLKTDFTWVKIIENNDIKGFAENNNLALRQAVGKYCFVVNDDTEMKMPVIDELVKTIKSLPDSVAILSPTTLNRDGSIQRAGKPRYSLLTFLLGRTKLLKYYDRYSKYTNKKGVFKTYNISGAAFLIKRDIFEKVNWFDEQYFFCPEDIALSSLLNEIGYECYVNDNARIFHYLGGTWSKIQIATMPSSEMGQILFYGRKSKIKKEIARLVILFNRLLGMFYWKLKNIFSHSEKSKIMFFACKNTVQSICTKKTPKEIFIKYYSK